MKKKILLIFILGLLLFIVPFTINIYSIFRLLSLLIGIILISLAICLHFKKNRVIFIMIVPCLIMAIAYISDISSFKVFNTIPIISFEEKSSSKMSTYNSIGYRIFDCDGNLSLDKNYQSNYQCEVNLLDTISINKFLASPKDSIKKYRNKFVHLEGKINTIIGDSVLYLNAYSETETTLNGFVKFDDQKSVVVTDLKINPADFYIYDYVEVVGLVNYESSDDGEKITLSDAKIVKSSVYDNYEVTISSLNNNTPVKKNDNIYYVGIEGIYYKYNKDIVYELSYLLNDKRISIESLTEQAEVEKINDNDVIYKADLYNVMICGNENIYFANKDYHNYQSLCELK